MAIIPAAHCVIMTYPTAASGSLPCKSAVTLSNSGVAECGVFPSRRVPQWCSAHCALQMLQPDYKGPSALFRKTHQGDFSIVEGLQSAPLLAEIRFRTKCKPELVSGWAHALQDGSEDAPLLAVTRFMTKCRRPILMGKQNLSFRTLKSESVLRGERLSQLRVELSRTWCCQRLRPQSSIRCQVAGTAVSGDTSPEIHDYIPNFTDKRLPLKIRALCFYLWTYTVAVPLFVVMVALQPFVLLFDKKRRKAQHFVNRIWAWLTISLFYKAEIVGLENLPSPDEPAVYVANHQSFLDIYSLFLLGRPFKFISKSSNFWIPIVGWAMYLTGHVPLQRLDRRSQMGCLKKCIELVKNGVPVFFFPEGTRIRDGKMAAFKKGAFSIATKGQVPVVPISLIGAGKLMPNGLEFTLRPGKVKIVIHPPLRGDNIDILCDQTRDVIVQTLVKHGMPVL